MRWSYWTIIFCNVVAPQALWFRQVRQSMPLMFFMSIIVQIGMWTERFVIVITSLHRDFLPSSWGMYAPTKFDWSTLTRHNGIFPGLFLPVHPIPAGDLDFRNARAGEIDRTAASSAPDDFEPKYAH